MLQSSDPFAGFDFATLQSTRMLPLMKALRALEAAKDDPRIKGIYLRMNGNGGVAGSALLEELREAIVDFKQSGKFVVAYNETYSQGQYYLASAADRIYMQPEGAMDWSGLSFNLAFYKGLLDKLDVKAEVFRPTACKYKSAVEPYILSKMSDANRESLKIVCKSLTVDPLPLVPTTWMPQICRWGLPNFSSIQVIRSKPGLIPNFKLSCIQVNAS